MIFSLQTYLQLVSRCNKSRVKSLTDRPKDTAVEYNLSITVIIRKYTYPRMAKLAQSTAKRTISGMIPSSTRKLIPQFVDPT